MSAAGNPQAVMAPATRLSMLDQASPRRYLYRYLVFNTTDPSSTASLLQRGFKAALLRFPVLRMRVGARAHSPDTGLLDLYPWPAGQDICFDWRERLQGNPVFSRGFRESYYRPSHLDHFEAFNVPGFAGQDHHRREYPVMTASVASAPEGIVLGLGFHNTILDEKSIFMVLQTIAEATKPGYGMPSPHTNQVGPERQSLTTYATANGQDTLHLPEYWETGLEDAPPALLLQDTSDMSSDYSSIITIPNTTVARIESEIRRHLNHRGISTPSFNAVSVLRAIFWIAAISHRHNEGPAWSPLAWVNFTTQFDLRAPRGKLTNPPLDENYFGNASLPVLTTRPLGDVTIFWDRDEAPNRRIPTPTLRAKIAALAQAIQTDLDNEECRKRITRLHDLHQAGDPQRAAQALTLAKDMDQTGRRPRGPNPSIASGIEFLSLVDYGGDLDLHIPGGHGRFTYRMWSDDADGLVVLLPRKGGANDIPEKCTSANWVFQVYFARWGIVHQLRDLLLELGIFDAGMRASVVPIPETDSEEEQEDEEEEDEEDEDEDDEEEEDEDDE